MGHQGCQKRVGVNCNKKIDRFRFNHAMLKTSLLSAACLVCCQLLLVHHQVLAAPSRQDTRVMTCPTGYIHVPAVTVADGNHEENGLSSTDELHLVSALHTTGGAQSSNETEVAVMAGTLLQPGTDVTAGRCEMQELRDPVHLCPNGTVSRAGLCLSFAPAVLECPKGYSMTAKECIREDEVEATFACEEGELQESKCIKRRKEPERCPLGTFEEEEEEEENEGKNGSVVGERSHGRGGEEEKHEMESGDRVGKKEEEEEEDRPKDREWKEEEEKDRLNDGGKQKEEEEEEEKEKRRGKRGEDEERFHGSGGKKEDEGEKVDEAGKRETEEEKEKDINRRNKNRTVNAAIHSLGQEQEVVGGGGDEGDRGVREVKKNSVEMSDDYEDEKSRAELKGSEGRSTGRSKKQKKSSSKGCFRKTSVQRSCRAGFVLTDDESKCTRKETVKAKLMCPNRDRRGNREAKGHEMVEQREGNLDVVTSVEEGDGGAMIERQHHQNKSDQWTDWTLEPESGSCSRSLTYETTTCPTSADYLLDRSRNLCLKETDPTRLSCPEGCRVSNNSDDWCDCSTERLAEEECPPGFHDDPARRRSDRSEHCEKTERVVRHRCPVGYYEAPREGLRPLQCVRSTAPHFSCPNGAKLVENGRQTGRYLCEKTFESEAIPVCPKPSKFITEFSKCLLLQHEPAVLDCLGGRLASAEEGLCESVTHVTPEWQCPADARLVAREAGLATACRWVVERECPLSTRQYRCTRNYDEQQGGGKMHSRNKFARYGGVGVGSGSGGVDHDDYFGSRGHNFDDTVSADTLSRPSTMSSHPLGSLHFNNLSQSDDESEWTLFERFLSSDGDIGHDDGADGAGERKQTSEQGEPKEGSRKPFNRSSSKAKLSRSLGFPLQCSYDSVQVQKSCFEERFVEPVKGCPSGTKAVLVPATTARGNLKLDGKVLHSGGKDAQSNYGRRTDAIKLTCEIRGEYPPVKRCGSGSVLDTATESCVRVTWKKVIDYSCKEGGERIGKGRCLYRKRDRRPLASCPSPTSTLIEGKSTEDALCLEKVDALEEITTKTQYRDMTYRCKEGEVLDRRTDGYGSVMEGAWVCVLTRTEKRTVKCLANDEDEAALGQVRCAFLNEDEKDECVCQRPAIVEAKTKIETQKAKKLCPKGFELDKTSSGNTGSEAVCLKVIEEPPLLSCPIINGVPLKLSKNEEWCFGSVDRIAARTVTEAGPALVICPDKAKLVVKELEDGSPGMPQCVKQAKTIAVQVCPEGFAPTRLLEYGSTRGDVTETLPSSEESTVALSSQESGLSTLSETPLSTTVSSARIYHENGAVPRRSRRRSRNGVTCAKPVNKILHCPGPDGGELSSDGMCVVKSYAKPRITYFEDMAQYGPI